MASRKRRSSCPDRPANEIKYACKFQEKWKIEFDCITSSDKGESYVYCTVCNSHFGITYGGRGTEKFINKEIKGKIDAENVIVTDGKIYFEANLSKYNQIANLKSVERVFICILRADRNTLPGVSLWDIKKVIVRNDLWLHETIQSALEVVLKDRRSKGNTTDVSSTRKEVNTAGLDINVDRSEVILPKTEEEERSKDECEPPVNKVPRLMSKLRFRMICRCTGRIGRKIDPMTLQRDLGVGMKKLMDWKVDLRSPDIEISVHVSDDGLVVGIPITREPLSKRCYIQEYGLRSTVAYIMSSLLPLKTGDIVLDPMCGKATILVESAYENKTVSYLGCDKDLKQLTSATNNLRFANLTNVHLFQGNTKDLPLPSCSVDHIVCDAPFGNKHIVDVDLEEFNRLILTEFTRVLKPEGHIVLLTSQDIHLYISKIFQKGVNTDSYKDQQHITDRKGDNSVDSNPEDGKVLNVSNNSESESNNKVYNSYSTIDNLNNPCINQNVVESTKYLLKSASCKEHCENAEKETVSMPFTKLKNDDNILEQITLIESHYVKLGDTHAYICVFVKP